MIKYYISCKRCSKWVSMEKWPKHMADHHPRVWRKLMGNLRVNLEVKSAVRRKD